MKLEAVELIRLNVPLKSAFRISFSSVNMHEVVWVHAITDQGEGWAECGANDRPDYSSEYHTGAMAVLREFILPDLFKLGNDLSAEAVAPTLHWIKQHRMAKAAIETALLDAQLRASSTSFATYLGSTRDKVPAEPSPYRDVPAVPFGSWERLRQGKDVAILAVGTMVLPAVQAAERLEKSRVATRVVSMPCREWFEKQSRSYQDKVLPPAVRARVSVEAGISMGWHDVVGDAGRRAEHVGDDLAVGGVGRMGRAGGGRERGGGDDHRVGARAVVNSYRSGSEAGNGWLLRADRWTRVCWSSTAR